MTLNFFDLNKLEAKDWESFLTSLTMDSDLLETIKNGKDAKGEPIPEWINRLADSIEEYLD